MIKTVRLGVFFRSDDEKAAGSNMMCVVNSLFAEGLPEPKPIFSPPSMHASSKLYVVKTVCNDIRHNITTQSLLFLLKSLSCWLR